MSWWLFTVLGCMVGSCCRGLAPWVILADGPGGLICARICPGTLSRRWYANTSGSIGHEGGGRRTAGPFAVPVIAADLRAPNFGSKREPGADLPRMQGLAQRYGVDRDTLARVPATVVRWRARR